MGATDAQDVNDEVLPIAMIGISASPVWQLSAKLHYALVQEAGKKRGKFTSRILEALEAWWGSVEP